jgi:hypothetical protein
MAKGFVFTLDALLAVVLLLGAAGGVYMYSSSSEESASDQLLFRYQSEDMLAVLDMNGDLASMNATRINATLSSEAPAHLKWQLAIDYYQYGDSGFSKNSSISLGSNFTAVKVYSASERAFLAMNKSSARYYGIARMTVWSG